MACLGPDGTKISVAPNGIVLSVEVVVDAQSGWRARRGAEIAFAVRADGGLNLIYADGRSDRACLSRENTVEVLAWLWRNAMARPLTMVEHKTLAQFVGMKRTAAQALDWQSWADGYDHCLTLERLGYLRHCGADPAQGAPVYELTAAGRVALATTPIDATAVVPEAK